MTLQTTIISRIREIHPEIAVASGRITGVPDDITCGVYLDQDGLLKIDFVGADFNEAADAAIPAIDAFFSTTLDLDADTQRARVAYAHGMVLRCEMGAPCGYQCVFEQEIIAAQTPAPAAKETILEAA